MQALLRWGVIHVLVLSVVAWAGPVEMTESADEVDGADLSAAEADAPQPALSLDISADTDVPLAQPITQSEPTALPARRAPLIGEDHLDLDVAISPGTILNVGPEGVVLIEWDADSMQLTRRSYRLVDPRLDEAASDMPAAFINIQPITSQAHVVDESDIESPQISLIPEPAGLAMLTIGLAAIVRRPRRR
jgi:hypothetical protein